MDKGYALWAAKDGSGYVVEVFNANGTMLRHHSAGDSLDDSTRFCTGDVPLKKLRKYAQQTAKEMMSEVGITGKVEELTDLECLLP